ncbi:MAG: tetratricopeptide repeat protein [Desulfuromonadales bacterium]|nr:tetratricopeptide repeat protein [Desulfuromonadales bacterium]
MSFLSRWFGSRNPLDEIRKASSQGRWADVLSFSSAIEDNALPASEKAELCGLVNGAADNLARINFEEGLASLRADNFRRGMEHLDLARQLVRSSVLRDLIDAEFSRIGSSSDFITGTMPPVSTTLTKSSCASSCCGTTISAPMSSPAHAGDFDEETRFDLVLTAYPSDLRSRYLELSPLMRQAILLAHEERDDEALELFSTTDENERNDLFYYETGALLARKNQYHEAVKALQQAISMNPAFILAALTLVDLHIGQKNYAAAENLLSQMLKANFMPDYCHARFAQICQSQGDSAKAFEHATEALNLGNKDPELMVFVARTLEAQGRIDEAEAVLSAIPVGGGCSGGANVELADFWLRHKKNLQKSLEMFKNAAKGDPANPLWGYNIARVYLALGWTKEGRQILQTFVDADSIDCSLRENAIQLLKGNA